MTAECMALYIAKTICRVPLHINPSKKSDAWKKALILLKEPQPKLQQLYAQSVETQKKKQQYQLAAKINLLEKTIAQLYQYPEEERQNWQLITLPVNSEEKTFLAKITPGQILRIRDFVITDEYITITCYRIPASNDELQPYYESKVYVDQYAYHQTLTEIKNLYTLRQLKENN